MKTSIARGAVTRVWRRIIRPVNGRGKTKKKKKEKKKGENKSIMRINNNDIKTTWEYGCILFTRFHECMYIV